MKCLRQPTTTFWKKICLCINFIGDGCSFKSHGNCLFQDCLANEMAGWKYPYNWGSWLWLVRSINGESHRCSPQCVSKNRRYVMVSYFLTSNSWMVFFRNWWRRTRETVTIGASEGSNGVLDGWVIGNISTTSDVQSSNAMILFFRGKTGQGCRRQSKSVVVWPSECRTILY